MITNVKKGLVETFWRHFGNLMEKINYELRNESVL